MKKTVLRVISLVLCLTLIMGGSAFASADGESAATDTTPTRISIVFNGEATSARGFTWYTKANTASVIEIKTLELCDDSSDSDTAYDVEYAEVTEWEGNFMHKATVSGLEAGQTYFYRVGDGTTFSEWGSFVTDNGDDNVEFIAIADIQSGNLNNFLQGARVTREAFNALPGAEFMVNLGDFTDDSTNEEWDYYDTAMGKINANTTLAPVSGNHDGLGVPHWFNNMFNLDTSESVQVKDGVNYSFDYGNVHFAVLNTNDLLSISIPQLKWLENDLNSTDKDWKIVLMHKSPYSLGKDAKWPDALYLQSSLRKVIDKCDVDLVMSGHDHQYIRTKPLKKNKVDTENGTTYVLSGTAGAKRYEIRTFLAGHFMKTEWFDAITIQRSGGNYWDGEDWDQQNPDYEGGIFNTISVDGGTLTLKSYVVSDYTRDENGNIVDLNEEAKVTLHDTYTVTKETGKNEITFTGDNTTSEAEYNLMMVPSFLKLAVYAFTEWLPKFLGMVPDLLESVIVYDVF